jgi:hypothetical protein
MGGGVQLKIQGKISAMSFGGKFSKKEYELKEENAEEKEEERLKD